MSKLFVCKMVVRLFADPIKLTSFSVFYAVGFGSFNESGTISARMHGIYALSGQIDEQEAFSVPYIFVVSRKHIPYRQRYPSL